MDYQLIIILLAAFFTAGFVKGMVGMGLPTVSLVLLCIMFDISAAMALLLAPSLLTNLWQTYGSISVFQLFRRLWPLYICSAVTVALGVYGFTFLEAFYAEQLLGFVLSIYATLSIFGLRLTVQDQKTSLFAGCAGALTGLLTGLTGSFVVPSIMFLQAIRLSVAEFIQATGLLFSLLTLSLGFSLYIAERITIEISILSLAGVIPAFIGMFFGYQIRTRLKVDMFRLLLNICLLIIGIKIFVTPLIT